MTISKCLELTVFIFNNKYPSLDIVILYLWDIVILYLWNNYLGENEVFQTVFFSILVNRILIIDSIRTLIIIDQ